MLDLIELAKLMDKGEGLSMIDHSFLLKIKKEEERTISREQLVRLYEASHVDVDHDFRAKLQNKILKMI